MANPNKCYGCGVCSTVCPTKSIKMLPNKEGFLYPKIDSKSCIKCGKCDRVCPITSKRNHKDNIMAYAAFNRNEKERSLSSSGGIFLPVAKKIIEHQGVVFGASFDSRFRVVHTYAETNEELLKFCGSKYLQSDPKGSMLKVEEFLKSGRIVLFCGTPCQIAGLKKYLVKDYDNLYTLDFICHGVSSPVLWEKYLKSFKSGMPKTVSFRDKTYGWNNYCLKIEFDNKTYLSLYKKDRYMNMFLSDLTLRESCYNCGYRINNSFSDITLADFWNVEKLLPHLNDNKGISLVVVESKKGSELLNEIANDIEFQEIDYLKAISLNKSANESPKRNNRRDIYLKSIKNKNFNYLYKYRFKPTKIERIKTKLYKVINK